LSIDLADFEQIKRLIAEHQPSHIFHLAANSTTRHDALFENHQTIATGTLNILEAVHRHSRHTRVFVTGSGVQFRNTGKPIHESDPFEASSPYALARIHSTYAARYYRSLGIQTYVSYLFHHESPLRKPHHVSKLIADAARQIAAGTRSTLEIGDITVAKEWTFAGDVAEAIWTLVQQDHVHEAVIGSGETHTIEEWLQLCFGHVKLRWQDHVTFRDGFRPEYSRLVSDPTTIKSLGWRPRVSLPSLADMMMAQPAPTT
jgi:GDPmannose 4,6-dehydratase